jgi:hypothetical protein
MSAKFTDTGRRHMATKAPFGQEQRLTFRVTVGQHAGVEACVVLAGRKLSAEVGDISAEGLFVTLARGPLAALKIGSMVDVEVSFEADVVTLFGVIRSEHAGGYGVHFPERDPAGRLNPLRRFSRISAQLQRTSLSQRLKVLEFRD